MGKTVRGQRDGTGPFKGSFQAKNKSVGRRRASGTKCPVKKKRSK